jgi:type II secretory pathway component PulL
MIAGGAGRAVMEAASLVVVGALWGCTNPLLLRGSNKIAADNKNSAFTSSTGKDSVVVQQKDEESRPTLVEQLTKFRHITVWLPYALNQCGSLVFYLTLSQSTGLSLAGPACNALALVFSVVTSWYIGETIRRPVSTVVGAALVMVGVAICCASQHQHEQLQ